MTEKTDIKALRDKHALALKDLTERLTECNRRCYFWDELSAFAAFSSTVIDQLEAERQRADEFRDCVRVIADQLSVNAMPKAVIEAVAELAALRGTQEPVAWQVTTPSGCIVFHAEAQDMEGHSYYGNTVTPLFTHPQKLTDLSYDVLFNAIGKAVSIQGSALSISVRAFKVALKAACIVVKDGE